MAGIAQEHSIAGPFQARQGGDAMQMRVMFGPCIGGGARLSGYRGLAKPKQVFQRVLERLFVRWAKASQFSEHEP